MHLENLIKNMKKIGTNPLISSLLVSSILGNSLYLSGCEKKIIIIQSIPEDSNNQNNNSSQIDNPSSQIYNNVTGTWGLSARKDFSNDEFTGGLDVKINFTQTNTLLEGYSKDVYKLVGNFSDLSILLQRKSDGTIYPIFQGGSGSIIDGGININLNSHNLKFNLASQNYLFKGVAPNYESMWGDMTIQVNLGPEGRTTLTGKWDAKRK